MEGPLAEERAFRLFHEGYTKGTKNPTFIENMVKADWMLKTGKSSYEWGNQSIADNKLIVAGYLGERDALKYAIRDGILLAFSQMNKKKQK